VRLSDPRRALLLPRSPDEGDKRRRDHYRSLPGGAGAGKEKFEPRRGFFTREVTLEEIGHFRSLQLSAEQVDQISVVQKDPAVISADPEEFFLLVEAHRIRFAHQFDPMLAVSVSKVDPLPHQIEADYHYAHLTSFESPL
jgi:hypothetical protein